MKVSVQILSHDVHFWFNVVLAKKSNPVVKCHVGWKYPWHDGHPITSRVRLLYVIVWTQRLFCVPFERMYGWTSTTGKSRMNQNPVRGFEFPVSTVNRCFGAEIRWRSSRLPFPSLICGLKMLCSWLSRKCKGGQVGPFLMLFPLVFNTITVEYNLSKRGYMSQIFSIPTFSGQSLIKMISSSKARNRYWNPFLVHRGIIMTRYTVCLILCLNDIQMWVMTIESIYVENLILFQCRKGP